MMDAIIISGIHMLPVQWKHDGILCTTVDCLGEHMPAGEVMAKLNSDILHQLPEHIRKKIIPFADGASLRLPTEREIFGVNTYGTGEDILAEQWLPMQERRNRIALLGENGTPTSYWLRDTVRFTADRVVCVSELGDVACARADTLLGVRPVFKLSLSITDIRLLHGYTPAQ